MTATATRTETYLPPEASRGGWATSFAPADFAAPTGREEAWRFSPMKALKPVLDGEPSDAHLAADHIIPDGVTLEVLPEDHDVRRLVPQPADLPAALAHAHSGGAIRVVIPREADVAEPIRLRFHGTGERVYGHVIVDAAPHSRAIVVIEYTGTARYTELVSVNCQDGAHLTVASAQLWNDDAVHVSQHDVVVGRDAHAKHVALSLGGSVVRMSANAHYAGPGGTAELFGAYLAADGQHLEHRSFVDHSTPNCTSDVLYKGALHGKGARTVWIGDVLIRAAAEGTTTYELNRNLVLTDGARADSVPNLEIETGEIEGAGHASATGQLDDDHLFYMQARGIPPEMARRLVVRGFFADIVHRIGVADISDVLMERVETELDDVDHAIVSLGETGE